MRVLTDDDGLSAATLSGSALLPHLTRGAGSRTGGDATLLATGRRQDASSIDTGYCRGEQGRGGKGAPEGSSSKQREREVIVAFENATDAEDPVWSTYGEQGHPICIPGSARRIDTAMHRHARRSGTATVDASMASVPIRHGPQKGNAPEGAYQNIRSKEHWIPSPLGLGVAKEHASFISSPHFASTCGGLATRPARPPRRPHIIPSLTLRDSWRWGIH